MPHQVGPLAFRTAGDAIDLPFDLTIESLQRWTLVYLGLSSLVFVLVWVLGYLRR
ncbi:MAG: cytochrome B6 [Cyanobacteria bacterium]|nr:cytochrome B6 [Cyanobacteriota bacterium]